MYGTKGERERESHLSLVFTSTQPRGGLKGGSTERVN